MDRCNLILITLICCTTVIVLTLYSVSNNIFRMPSSFMQVQRSELLPSDKIILAQKTKEFLRNSTERLKILVSPAPFGDKLFGVIGYSSDPDYSCGNCEIVFDRNQIYDPLTKAVVFHFAELRPEKIPTTDRRSDQLYIFWAMESPPNIRDLRGITLDKYDKVFNLTMTYRQDSDIYSAPYTAANVHRQLKNLLGDKFSDVQAVMTNKSKLVTWLVSNCIGKRMQVVADLVAAGLDLDARGACFGTQSSPARGKNMTTFISGYKFYLAFENSWHCRDYITKKVYVNAMLSGTVPVAFGAARADYEAALPPHSFIYVEDFATSEELVEYLNYLDKNDTAYAEYFRWRTMRTEDMPNYGRATGMCHLCRVIHGVNVDNLYNPNYDDQYRSIPLFGYPNRPRVVDSLREWEYGLENRECLPNY